MGLDLTQDAMTLATETIEPFNRRDFDSMIAMSGGQIDYTDVALGQHITDGDAFKAAMQAWVDAFDDIQGTVTSAARDGDLLAYEVVLEGTHTGPLQTPMGAIPASGRRVSTRAAFFTRLDGDRVAEVRNYGDILSMLAQISAVPAQGTSADTNAPAASTG